MKKPALRNFAYDGKGSGSFTIIGRVRMTTLIRVMTVAVLWATLCSVPVLSQTREVWVHTTVADFSGCGIPNGASVTNMAGGEVRLPALVEDYFDEPDVDTGRWIVELEPGSVVDGVLTVDGSWVRSVASVGQGDFPVAVEGRIRIAEPGVGTGWADFGLGKPDQISGPPNALFITDGDGNVYANDYQPGTTSPQRTQITGFDWTEYHDFRFMLFSDRVDYYVDDTLQVSHSLDTPMTTPLYLWFYSLYAGFDVSTDWLRVSRYPANDQYTSCPVDVGRDVSWGYLLREEDLPAGTSASYETRSSGDGQSYSGWTPLGASREILSPNGRYLQYRISMSTSDPMLSPQIDEVSITIGPNTAPTAYDQALSTDEDTAVAITLTGSDPDGDSLIYSVVDGPTNGVLSGEGENLIYTPDADYNGADSFTFQVTDRIENSNIATVNITVDPVNDPPVAENQAVTTDEDTAVAITLAASDVEGDALTYSVVDEPANGVLSGTAADMTYTPDVGYRGQDSFTFRVNDGAVDSNLATVTIDVIEVNDPPAANDEVVSTDEDTAVAITLVASDEEGDALTYSVVDGPTNGVLSGTAPNVTYTPDPDYNGVDSFTFRANDGQADSNLATVSITVISVEDLPVADDQTVRTRESTPVAITLTASDGDGDALTYSVVDGPSNGALSGGGANLTYTPDAGYRGTDRFTFRANDGQADSNLATVTISVVSGNYALSFDGSNDVVRAGQVPGTGPLTVEAWVQPDDANANGIMIVVTDDVNGWSFELNSGRPTLWLSTNQGWQLAQHLTVLQAGEWVHVAATYGNGAVRLFVDGVASGVTNVGALTQGPALNIGGFGGYPYFDGTIDEVRISNIVRYTSDFVPSSDAPFSPDANTLGLWHFDEGEGQVASDVSSSANDGTLGDTGNVDGADPTWVDGYVSAGSPPVAEGLVVSTSEDTPVAITLTASDADGDALSYSLVDGPANGALSGTAPDVTYTPDVDYNGPDSFTFRANDGQADSNLATVSITVTPVDDPPVAEDQTVSTDENTVVAITLTASDVDGDALTYSVVDGPTNGVLSGTAPNVTYTPDPDYNGADSFTFRVNDGTADSDLATVSITVVAVNDVPVAEDQAVGTDEDTPVAITLAASDGDGDALTYSVEDGPTNGVLSGVAPNVTYTPDADYNGADSFTFRANDGQADSNLATVSITVNSVDDPPVAEDQAVSTSENTPVAITLVASDVDGDTLTYSVVDSPANGVLSGVAPNVTYTPNAGYMGVDSFTFRANDGQADSNLATVTINVTEVNDPPVAEDQGVSTDEDTPVAITLVASDGDGDALIYGVVDGPANGVLSGTAADVTYTPDPDYNGADSFTFRANDGQADSNLATVSITVNPVDDPPVAEGQAVSTNEDTAVAITLVASDVDGDALTYSVVDGPTNGVLSGTAPNVTYTPDPDYNGADSFTFRVNDGTADSDLATVSITVVAVNDVPVAEEQEVSTDEDTPVEITLTGSDEDVDGYSLRFYGHGVDDIDRVRIPIDPQVPADVGASDFTLEWWMRAYASENNSATCSPGGDNWIYGNIIFDRDVWGTGDYGEYGISLAGGQLAFGVHNGTSGDTLCGANNVADGTWHHIAVTRRQSDGFMRIFVDGQLDGEMNGPDGDISYRDGRSTTYGGDPFLVIGAEKHDISVAYPSYSGWLDEVRLSSILRYASAFSPPSEPFADDSNTLALYHLDAGPAGACTGTIEDSSAAPGGPSDGTCAYGGTDPAGPVYIADGDVLTFEVVEGPANGVLSGSGANLTYTPDADYNGSDSFSFRINDGQEDSNLATVSIAVNAVNDAPVAQDQTASTSENTPVAITLMASDVDGDTLTYSVVGGPSNGALSGGGVNLTYTPNAGYGGVDSFTYRANDGSTDSNLATVTISVVSGSYALSFDGSNDVVRAGQVPGTGPLTIEAWVQPDDANANGLMVVGADDVNGWSFELNSGRPTLWLSTNQGWQYGQHATVLQAGEWYHVAATYENGALRMFVDGVASGVTNVGTLTQGSSLNMGGLGGYPYFDGTIDEVRISNIVRYTSDFVPSPDVPFSPDANTLGLWHFDEGGGQVASDVSFSANDGTLGDTGNVDAADPAWVDGYVSAGSPPVSEGLVVSTSEDTPVAITLTASDADGDALTYSVVDGPTNGALSGTAPDVTYTPDVDYNGPDSFTFRANDGQADSNLATVSITVTPVDDPPVAEDQTVSTDENTVVNITLAGSDVDGDTLTYSVVDGPTNGVLNGTAPNVTYTPDPDYNGADSFTFRVNDGTADSDLATVSITVVAVNDVPVADDQAVSTDEDTPVVVTLTASDADGDALTYSVVDGPTNGVLSGVAPNVTYTPDADYNGADSFTFRANDGQADSNLATASITVNPVDDPPVAEDQAVSTSENTPVAITLVASDVDGDALTYSVVDSPANGVLSGVAPNVTYTPNAGYMGVDSFTFRANDGQADSNLATVTINVTEVNDPPVAEDQGVSTDEDTPVAITLVASDGDGDALTYGVVDGPANGVLSGTAANVTYTPDPDYNGADSFTFRANDGQADSNLATVSITVNPVDDPPVAEGQAVSTNEDTAVAITLTASDVDGDALTYGVVDGPTNGVLSGTAPNVTYTPDPDYNGADSFTFRANDGTTDSNLATVSITVVAVNDVPVAEDQEVSTDEDTPVEITLTGSDVDGDALTFEVVDGPTSGVLGGGGANLTYMPDANYNGADSFTFRVNDGQADSNVTTVSITVNPVNDAPVADDQDVSTSEDTPVDITLTGSDVDGDALTFEVVDGPTNGTLSGSGATRTYAPDAGYTGSDSFTFQANDGQQDSNVATVSISVVGGSYALSFDGNDDIVRADQVPGTGPLTVEAWVRPDDNNANGLMIVGADDYDGWSLELYGGQLTLWLSTNQGWQFLSHSTALQAGQWVHVAATYENDTLRVFVDGVASTATSVGTLTQGPWLRIGGLPGYPFFDGAIDEVRISSVVRYTSDFVPSSTPFSADANTLGLWHFDEGAGQSASDVSTSANGATLGNSGAADSADPTWVEGYPW